MKFEQQNQKEKMLTDNIDETMERSINHISSDISKPLQNKNIINETVNYQKKLNGPDVTTKLEIKNNIPDINSEEDSSNKSSKKLSNNNDKPNSYWSDIYKPDNCI